MSGIVREVNLPQARFDVVLADPPWSYHGQQDKWGAAAKFYETMSDEALLAMPVRRLLNDRGVLFLWATCPRLNTAIDCIRTWKLHYRGVAFVWVKSRADGMPIGAQGVRPSIVKPTVELLLCASPVARGRPMPLGSESVRQVIMSPRGRHSEKPTEAYERIEELYPSSSKIELFARSRRDGWDAWGDEMADRGLYTGAMA